MRVGRVRRGQAGKNYYVGIAHEAGEARGGYYLNGGPAGSWFGRLAPSMGLSGSVDAADFGTLHDGYSPQREALSKNPGHPKRRPAFDVTHSLIKDASVIASVSDTWRERIIDRVAAPAVQASLRYLEREACLTRRGTNGSRLVRGQGFVGGAFTHITAREVDGICDPQIHTHAVIMNTTRGPDGQLRTLCGDALFDHARAASALSSVEESYQLMQLGFTLERDGRTFVIVGVPEGLREEYSRRSKQIREEAGVGADARARDRANWLTRAAKKDTPLSQILADWGERNERHGLTPERVRELTRATPREVDAPAELQGATQRALEKICEQRSTFSARDFLELVALESLCRGVRADDVRLHVEAEIEKARGGEKSGLVLLGRDADGYETWSTRQLWELERRILAVASKTSGRASWVSAARVEDVIQERPTLSPEQARAVRHLCLGPGSIKCVVGGAGAGKTFMLDCARAAIEQSGGRVIGTSLSSRATRGLAEQAHIRECYNVRKLVYELDRKRLVLKSTDVILMDEAAVTGTKDYARIVHEVVRSGATLACIGDHRQHQAIQASGVFLGLSRRDPGTAELTTIIRQRSAEDKRMVAALRDNRMWDAVRSLASRGRLHVGEDVPSAQDHLVKLWSEDLLPLEGRAIIASTNRQVDALNRRCQGVLNARRPDAGAGVEIRDARAFAGDRVMCRRNFAAFDVCNGDMATLLHADAVKNELRLRLDDGKRIVTLPLSHYGAENVSLAFAVTSFKSQCSSYENVYLLVHGRMTDAQTAYVMGSRHRNMCNLHTTEESAGEELGRLVSDASRSRVKLMAHDAEVVSRDPDGCARPELEHVR